VIERHIGQAAAEGGPKADAPDAVASTEPCWVHCGAPALIRVAGCDKCVDATVRNAAGLIQITYGA